ncbi:hypothetical protein TWF694_005533 [Orbilia ellipsospora]|uniref:Uncharacterized protein n=1 Tax=Orbilia ellipsospora TaxID=2528407 RepID=A0AAV9WVG6_9PEZI
MKSSLGPETKLASTLSSTSRHLANSIFFEFFALLLLSTITLTLKYPLTVSSDLEEPELQSLEEQALLRAAGQVFVSKYPPLAVYLNENVNLTILLDNFLWLALYISLRLSSRQFDIISYSRISLSCILLSNTPLRFQESNLEYALSIITGAAILTRCILSNTTKSIDRLSIPRLLPVVGLLLAAINLDFSMSFLWVCLCIDIFHATYKALCDKKNRVITVLIRHWAVILFLINAVAGIFLATYTLIPQSETSSPAGTENGNLNFLDAEIRQQLRHAKTVSEPVDSSAVYSMYIPKAGFLYAHQEIEEDHEGPEVNIVVFRDMVGVMHPWRFIRHPSYRGTQLENFEEVYLQHAAMETYLQVDVPENSNQNEDDDDRRYSVSNTYIPRGDGTGMWVFAYWPGNLDRGFRLYNNASRCWLGTSYRKTGEEGEYGVTCLGQAKVESSTFYFVDSATASKEMHKSESEEINAFVWAFSHLAASLSLRGSWPTRNPPKHIKETFFSFLSYIDSFFLVSWLVQKLVMAAAVQRGRTLGKRWTERVASNQILMYCFGVVLYTKLMGMTTLGYSDWKLFDDVPDVVGKLLGWLGVGIILEGWVDGV